jgi:hypothetical protein
MANSSKSPRDKFAIGWKHLLDQRVRIERHRDFIGRLERDGQADVIAEARRLLREMEETFARMQADVRRGRDSSM